MKAWQLISFEGATIKDKLALKTLDIPAPGPHEIRVRVYSTSINPVEHKQMNGNWWGATLPWILGTDVAGVVESVGSHCSKWKVGDEVCYCAHLSPAMLKEYSFAGGSYAEYQIVEEGLVAYKPKHLTFAEASTLGLAGCTAYDIVMRTNIRPGDAVFVAGAGGGVGTFVVQMAKAHGATIYATTGAASVESVKALGAAAVWDYKTTPDFVAEINKLTDGKGVDVVLDLAGGETLSKALDCIKSHGRMSSIVSTTGNLQTAFRKNISLFFEFMERTGQKMNAVVHLANTGHVKAVIHSVIPFEELPSALELNKGGHLKGSVVVQIHPDANKTTVKH